MPVDNHLHIFHCEVSHKQIRVCIFVLLHKEHPLTNRNSATWSIRYIKR